MSELEPLKRQIEQAQREAYEVQQSPLFPDQHRATDIQITYVQTPGGEPDPRVTPYVRDILLAQIEPVLHVTFRVGGQLRTTLIGIGALRNRGLPTDYERLSQMFPALRWSER